VSARRLSRPRANAIVTHMRAALARSLLLLSPTLYVVACANAPIGAGSAAERATPAYDEPTPDEARAPLTVVVAAPPSEGPLAIHVSLDGRAVPFEKDARRRALFVRPGALFVDVTLTREEFALGDDALVPERQLVPCGRGRMCERTVMTPRTRPLAIAEEVVVCRRGQELLIARDRPHVVHVASDGRGGCRVRCHVGDAAPNDATAIDDAAPLDDCSVAED